MDDYAVFLASKQSSVPQVGIDADCSDYDLMPHQRDLTRFALRRGRAAIFADTGLGKTRIEVVWADVLHKHVAVDSLILAPLAVAQQTVEESAAIGVNVTHARSDSDIRPGINITNYDRLHLFDTARFGAVALDESSIIKHHTAKTLQTLIDAFIATPYKLCATATPAPNDWTELGTHAEFLGVRSRTEMLAEFFVHDGAETQTWRLKGHGREVFWRWVAHWGALVRSPADLGHDASMYDLPPLNVHQHVIDPRFEPTDGLFHTEAHPRPACAGHVAAVAMKRRAFLQTLAGGVAALALPKIVLPSAPALFTGAPIEISGVAITRGAMTNFANLTAAQKALWSADIWRRARDQMFVQRFMNAMQRTNAPMLLIRSECPYCGRAGARDLFDRCFGCGMEPVGTLRQIAATRRTLPQPAAISMRLGQP